MLKIVVRTSTFLLSKLQMIRYR